MAMPAFTKSVNYSISLALAAAALMATFELLFIREKTKLKLSAFNEIARKNEINFTFFKTFSYLLKN